MGRKKYIAIRSVQTVLLIWGVLTFLFFLFRLMPGDFADQMLHHGASQEEAQQFRESWGLDQPLHVQYYNYLINFVQGDVGRSIQHRTPVLEYVKMRVFNSFLLAGPAITLAYVFASIYGTILGSTRDSLLERYGIIPFLLLSSIPSFFMAILAIIVMSSALGLFPSYGMISPSTYQAYSEVHWLRPYLTTDFLWHYALPFSVVFLRFAFLPLIVMRSSVVEVMGQEFIYYYRLSGLPSRRRMRHISKHAILPVITLYPISMTQAIGGIVLIETVFNWPGIGYALVVAVSARDYPVLTFIFFLVAAFVIIANFVIDLLYGYIDPRVTIGDESA